MVHKRSKQELIRLVEEAVSEVCGLPRPGLWFCVDELETVGRPTSRLKIWATLHFLPEGSPFCCGEPGCHLGLFGNRLIAVGEQLRRALGLRQEVAVDFADRIGVNYHEGVRFRISPSCDTGEPKGGA
jgi:hypothetical protein